MFGFSKGFKQYCRERANGGEAEARDYSTGEVDPTFSTEVQGLRTRARLWVRAPVQRGPRKGQSHHVEPKLSNLVQVAVQGPLLEALEPT